MPYKMPNDQKVAVSPLLLKRHPSKKAILDAFGYVPVAQRKVRYENISCRCPEDIVARMPAVGTGLRSAWMIEAFAEKVARELV